MVCAFFIRPSCFAQSSSNGPEQLIPDRPAGFKTVGAISGKNG
jgi:hypothetical protein